MERPSFGRVRLQVVIALAAILVLTAVVGYIALTATTVTVPAEGGTYTEGIVGSPMSINPVLCQSNPVDQDLVALVFSGLTRVNSQGEVEPDLAERYFLLRIDARPRSSSRLPAPSTPVPRMQAMASCSLSGGIVTSR